jgi:tetratricopeptide (TPR) repeat protein
MIRWSLLLAVFLTGVGTAQGDTKEFIRIPDATWAKTQLDAWLAKQNPDKEILETIHNLWQAPPDPTSGKDTLLARTIASFGIAEPEVAEFLASTTAPANFLDVPNTRKVLELQQFGEFYSSNMRLHLGRQLVQRELYEEALELLEKASVDHAVEPVTLLYYLAICQKQLGMKTQGLETLATILDRIESEKVPQRYRSTAVLMKDALEALEEKSLDDAADKMRDVQRRLQLARAGEKTQKVQKQIVDILDDLIKKAEDKKKNQDSQSQANGNGGGAPKGGAKPAGDSEVKGAKAPGEVTPKKLAKGGAWGNLDEKERKEAKQAVSRDFPPYYRQAIEEYFRKLAERE